MIAHAAESSVLAAAQAAQAASSTRAAGGMTLNARATAAAAAANPAFMASLGPVGWLLIGIAGGVALLAGAYDLALESETKAAEAAKAHADHVREGTEKAVAAMMRERALLLDLNKARRDGMSFADQQNSYKSDISGMLTGANAAYGESQGVDPAAEQAHLKASLDYAERAKALNDERLAKAREYREEEITVLEEKLKQIEAQEKILASAEKQKEDRRGSTPVIPGAGWRPNVV